MILTGAAACCAHVRVGRGQLERSGGRCAQIALGAAMPAIADARSVGAAARAAGASSNTVYEEQEGAATRAPGWSRGSAAARPCRGPRSARGAAARAQRRRGRSGRRQASGMRGAPLRWLICGWAIGKGRASPFPCFHARDRHASVAWPLRHSVDQPSPQARCDSNACSRTSTCCLPAKRDGEGARDHASAKREPVIFTDASCRALNDRTNALVHVGTGPLGCARCARVCARSAESARGASFASEEVAVCAPALAQAGSCVCCRLTWKLATCRR